MKENDKNIGLILQMGKDLLCIGNIETSKKYTSIQTLSQSCRTHATNEAMGEVGYPNSILDSKFIFSRNLPNSRLHLYWEETN